MEYGKRVESKMIVFSTESKQNKHI